MFNVIYITGPPASGKTTLVKALASAVSPLEVLNYSRVLADYVSKRRGVDNSIDELRRQSSRMIEPDDIHAVDEHLLTLVGQFRERAHVVIDSHPVTKERYGYRITPFSTDSLRSLSPTALCMLYAEPSILRERIAQNSEGRPLVSTFEADFHTHLQCSVVVNYGTATGSPVHFLDASRPLSELANEVIELFLS